MPETSQSLIAAANAAVPRVSVEEALRLQAGGAVILDVRNAEEVAATGRVPGAVHAPRGRLEFSADPASPQHEPALRPDRTVVTYCGGGSRAALAGRLLKDMGFADVRNMGGFRDYAATGGPVER